MESQDIFNAIYDLVCLIPEGRVSTYGAIANCIGVKGGARVVGYAMNASHKSDRKVPAHRVVNRKGVLTGKHHFNQPETMQEMLEAEGVKIIEDQVLNFQEVFWDPMDSFDKYLT